MTQLLTFMIMAYGFTNILVYGSIFNGPRNFIREKSLDEGSLVHNQWKFLIDMLSCVMCCGTWVGFFFGVFLSVLERNVVLYALYSCLGWIFLWCFFIFTST